MCVFSFENLDRNGLRMKDFDHTQFTQWSTIDAQVIFWIICGRQVIGGTFLMNQLIK